MQWEGACDFTGEISAALLRDLFVNLNVCSGTANAAAFLVRSDEIVIRKLRAAHEEACARRSCVGETLAKRSSRGNGRQNLVDPVCAAALTGLALAKDCRGKTV